MGHLLTEPVSGWIAGCVPTFWEPQGLFAVGEVRVISTAGSGNDPHLQQGNFVSLENPPAASAALSLLLLARLSQHGYKNILKLPQSNVDQGFSHVTQPVTHRQGPGCPRGRPERLPMSPQASLDFGHLHWTPPTTHAFVAQQTKLQPSRQGFSMAHGSIELPPATEKSPFPYIFKQKCSAPSGPVRGTSDPAGLWGTSRAGQGRRCQRPAAISCPVPRALSRPPLHRLQPWPRRAPTGRGGGGKRTEPTGSCHWDANGAAAAGAPSPSASPPQQPGASPRQGHTEREKGFLL